MIVIPILFLLFLLGFLTWTILRVISHIQPTQSRAFYVKTRTSVVREIFSKIEPDAEKILIDLGSGDGRIVRYVAKKYGAYAIGYENSIWPYITSLVMNKIFTLSNPNIADHIEIKRISAFDADITNADYIYLYTSPGFNEVIESKLQNEMKEAALVISYVFRFPNWKPTDIHTVKGKKVFVYKKP